jgi:hypothetical protein
MDWLIGLGSDYTCHITIWILFDNVSSSLRWCRFGFGNITCWHFIFTHRRRRRQRLHKSSISTNGNLCADEGWTKNQVQGTARRCGMPCRGTYLLR